MNAEMEDLDTEVLDSLKDAIGDSLPRIINLFLTDVPNSLQEMQHSLDLGDLSTVGRLAHSLKSSSANLGAMRISTLAIGLEQAINHGETDRINIESAITSIQTAFDQASHKFDSYLQK